MGNKDNDIKPCPPPLDLARLAMRLNMELRILRSALDAGTLRGGVVRDALRGIEWVKQQMEDYDND